MRIEDTTLLADLTLHYMGHFNPQVTIKGDVEGHPFRGNQYGSGEGGGSTDSDSEILRSSGGGSSATRGEVKRLHNAAKKWQEENQYTTPPNASDVIKAGVSHGGFTMSDSKRVYSVYRDNRPKE